MRLSVVLSRLLLVCCGFTGALHMPESTSRRLHQQMTALKNGAVLDVSITSPTINATLPMGLNVPFHANASVGLGEPDVSYIYIIDVSSSTLEPDGACGTVLDCVQEFFKALHKEAVSDGSAELASVIIFDDDATVTASLLNPTQTTEIEAAIEEVDSFLDTNCAAALTEAAALVEDPSNTAGTTVVVLAGDGLCNIGDTIAAADTLGATGAIVHTVAVGDSVNCSESQGLLNELSDIPRNGGTCTSVPDPGTLPQIIDDLIGTKLVSVELKVDKNGTYIDLNVMNHPNVLPVEGPISIDFNTSVNGLAEGAHEVCVRATGEDVLGGQAQVVDCHEFFVIAAEDKEEEDGDNKLEGWKIFLIVVVALSVVGLMAYAYRTYRTGKETTAVEEQVAPVDKAGGDNRPVVLSHGVV